MVMVMARFIVGVRSRPWYDHGYIRMSSVSVGSFEGGLKVRVIVMYTVMVMVPGLLEGSKWVISFVIPFSNL